MPKIVEYGIICQCKRCNKDFLKVKKLGNYCYDCKQLNAREYRQAYERKVIDSCASCGRKKKPSPNKFCSSCHHARYRAGAERRKVITKDDIKGLSTLVERINLKQSNFLFSLYDINDIINAWLMFTNRPHFYYDAFPSGRQIVHMWQDIIELEKIYSKNASKKSE